MRGLALLLLLKEIKESKKPTQKLHFRSFFYAKEKELKKVFFVIGDTNGDTNGDTKTRKIRQTQIHLTTKTDL